MGFWGAVRDVWGDDALRDIAARLPPETRRATFDEIVLALSWLPSGYISDWHEAVWNGPAKQDDALFCRFVDRSVELGFGRMQRFFLKLATPKQLVERAPEMWRRQHTHGQITVSVRGHYEHALPEAQGSPSADDTAAPPVATVTLRDHPFVNRAVSRRALAEVWRHILTLARAKDATESHRVEAAPPSGAPGARGEAGEAAALVVRLSWTR